MYLYIPSEIGCTGLDGITMPYKIMFADDEKMMRKFLRKTLSVKHDVIAEAKNGRDAVRKYKQVDVDLVILDIKMPKMDGLEALSEIKEIDSSQKVIMCTSVDEPGSVVEVMEKGADAYVVKPYKKKQLMETIDEVMS